MGETSSGLLLVAGPLHVEVEMRPVLRDIAALRSAPALRRVLRTSLVLLTLTDIWLVPAWGALVGASHGRQGAESAGAGDDGRRAVRERHDAVRRSAGCRCAPERIRAGRCCCTRTATATASCCATGAGPARETAPPHDAAVERVCGCGPESTLGLLGAAPRVACDPVGLIGALRPLGDVRVASDRASACGRAPELPPPKPA